MEWLEIDQDNLQMGTAKAVTRFMSFAEITCFVFFLSYQCTSNRLSCPLCFSVRLLVNQSISHLANQSFI